MGATHEKYLIVFGENAGQQIKNNLNQVRSYKEAAWLYDGMLLGDDDSIKKHAPRIFDDPKLAPSAILDNGKWLSPALFGNNQRIWQSAVMQCFEMARSGQIHCFAFT